MSFDYVKKYILNKKFFVIPLYIICFYLLKKHEVFGKK